MLLFDRVSPGPSLLVVGLVGFLAFSASPVRAQLSQTPPSSAVVEGEEAKIFREKLAKAEAGDPKAQVSVGDAFQFGNRRAGIQSNLVTAEAWYLKAASQGYKSAYDRLSEIHHMRAMEASNQGRSDSEELIESAKFAILAGNRSPSFRMSESSLAEARRRADAWLGQSGAAVPTTVPGPAPTAPAASAALPSFNTGPAEPSAAAPASSRSVSIVVGKGVRLDFERQNVVGQLWAEVKKSCSLSLDADIQAGRAGLPLQDNEECFDAFYRFLEKRPTTRSLTVSERCVECKGSGVKIVYGKDPKTALQFERTSCPVCMGGGKQDVLVTYSILCDASKVPAKTETPRMRNIKILAARASAGEPTARLQYAAYLLKGEQGVSRDVEKAKELYKGLVLAGVSEALAGLRESMELSVGKTIDDKRFIAVLADAASAVMGAEPVKPKSPAATVDETSRRMDAVGRALGAKPTFDIAPVTGSSEKPGEGKPVVAEAKAEPGYLDEAAQKVVVVEFTTLFKARSLTPAQLSYAGLVKSLASQSRAPGDYRGLVLNWLAQDKRTVVDLSLMKELKANAVRLDGQSIAFLAGVSEEGLSSAPNPLAAYVLYKMAYVQTGRSEYLDRVRRLEGTINKDLAQKVLSEFENLRRSRTPLDTYIDSVLSLK